MKDLIDAINTRIKEPYWGFFLLSFLAFNWKGIFLLCFAGESAQVRINLFEQQTDLWSLIVCPISTAIFILLITPWLKLLFGWLSRRAYEKLNSQELEREHKYIAEKNKLENERAVELANKEKELIDQAKRDIDIDKLEDDQVKQNLREEIEKLRNERDQASKQLFGEPNIIQIDEEEKEVLKAACLDKNGQIMRRTFIGGRFIQAGNLQLGKDNNMEFLKYDEALKSLKAKELIQDIGQKGEIFEISYKGWNLISKLELDK